MNINREKMLEGRQKALALLQHPDLPAEAKVAAKRALDHAETALGLDDAAQRKAARN
jgi:hypothetical protein